MKDPSRTNQALMEESASLKQKLLKLEQSMSDYGDGDEVWRESDEIFKKIFDTASDGIIIVDAITKMFLQANTAICSMLGYTKEEMKNLAVNDIHPQNSISHVLEEFEKQKRGEKVLAEGLPVLRKDGSIFYADISSAPTAIGGKDRLIGIFRDITERRRSEQEESILTEIGRLTSSTLDINEIYEQFAKEASKLITFDRIHVNLISSDGKSYTIAYVSGFDIAMRRPGDKVSLAGSISEAIAQTRSSLCFHPASVEEITNRFPNASAATTFRAGMRSIMAVPLISRDEVIGILHFRARKPNAYTQQDLSLAERIGSQIAGAISNARLFTDLENAEKEQRRHRETAERLANEMASVAEIGRVIGSSLDINNVFEQLASESRKLIPYDRLVVTLIKPDDDAFTVAYAAGLDHPNRRQGGTFPIAGSVTEAVWRKRSGIIAQAEDASEIIRTYPYTTVLQVDILSLMTVPLISQDKVIGAINFRSRQPNAYTKQDLRLAEAIGREIAGAITNASLFDKVKSELEERKRAEQEMAILADIGRLINSTMDIDEVYERFAMEVRKLISCDRISVDLNNPDESTFKVTYVSGFDMPERRPGAIVPIKGSISEVILHTRTGLFFNQASLEVIKKQCPLVTNISTIHAGMHSMISVPLISQDEVIGTLHFRAIKANAYAERDLRLAEKIGMQIASAIAKAQLLNDLKRTEQSLRESNELFSLVMHHSPIYAYIKEVTPTQSRFLHASENFMQMIGIPGSAMVGKTMAELFPPEFALKITADDWFVVSNGDVLTLDEEFNDRSYTTIKFPIILGDKSLLAGYTIDITERKRADETLQETLNHLESRVRERTIELEEINTALRVLLKKGEQDHKNLEEILQTNVNQLVMPFLHRLKATLADKQHQLSQLNIMETNLSNIVSPFINHLSAAFKNLTPREIEIAELIKQGKRSKEIAELIGVSVGTVITHRNNIRKKLNLKSKDANLRSHLLSLV